MTLLERMDAALLNGPLTYGELARRLWDPRSKAWRYSSNGGPPGCYMALSSGIRRGRFPTGSHECGQANASRLVYSRSPSGSER